VIQFLNEMVRIKNRYNFSNFPLYRATYTKCTK